MLPLADGYLLWSVLGATLRGLGWFAGLFLAFAVVTNAKRMTQSDLPFDIALQAVLLQIPRIVLFTIPASLLFGTVSTFTEMSSKGEITALMAGGMGLKRMLRAPLLGALVLAIFAFWLQEVVVPGAESKKDIAIKNASRKIVIKDGFEIVDKRPDGLTERRISARSFDAQTQVLVEPRAQIYNPDNTTQVEIQAPRARWDANRKSWIFQNGKTTTFPRQKSAFSVENPFDELALKTDIAPQFASKGNGQTVRKQLENEAYEMVSLNQLDAFRAEKQRQFATATGADRKLLRKQIRSISFGIHDKWATPLIVLAMVLVGAPLGVRPQRTASPGLAMGFSIMAMLGYYLVWTLCTQIGKGGAALPQLVAYTPFLVLVVTGMVLIWRKS